MYSRKWTRRPSLCLFLLLMTVGMVGCDQAQLDALRRHTRTAEDVAATTAEQNETWMTERRDRTLEQQILTDLANALRGRTQE